MSCTDHGHLSDLVAGTSLPAPGLFSIQMSRSPGVKVTFKWGVFKGNILIKLYYWWYCIAIHNFAINNLVGDGVFHLFNIIALK